MKRGLLAGVAALVLMSGVALANDYVRAELSDREQRAYFADEVTAARTLSLADCGKVFRLNAAAGAAVTLPATATAAGCELGFVVGAVSVSGQYTLVNADADNDIRGVRYGADAGLGAGASDTVTFVSASSAVGDRVQLIGDGTYWHGVSFSSALAGVTMTAAF